MPKELLIVCLIAFTGCTPASTGPPVGRPRLLTARDSVSLGVIPQRSHNVRIEIRNDGTLPLEIKSIETSCNCIAGSGTLVISPGSAGELGLEVRTAGPGPGGSRITIWSNDPDSPHSIAVSWFGEHPPKMVPSALVADLDGDEYQQDVAVVYATALGIEPLKIVSMQACDPQIVISDQPGSQRALYNRNATASNEIASASEHPIRIRFRLAESQLELNSECHFIVEQSGKQYALVLPVRVRRRSPIAALPPEIAFTAKSPLALIGLKRRVQVIFPAHTEPILLSVPEFLNCSLRSIPKSPMNAVRYLLEVEIRDIPDTRNAQEITLGSSTDSPHTLRIPLTIVTLE